MTTAASGKRRLGPELKERELWAVALPWASVQPGGLAWRPGAAPRE